METGLLVVACLIFVACVGEGIRRTIRNRRKARQAEIDWQQRAKELHEGSVYLTRQAKPSAWAAPARQDRRSAVRSFSSPTSSPAPSTAPSPDYLTQYLAWQYLTTPHSSPAPAPAPSYEDSCRASSYTSGGGGVFGGGGASSSWESSSSSDSSSSSSSDSSSYSSSD